MKWVSVVLFFVMNMGISQAQTAPQDCVPKKTLVITKRKTPATTKKKTLPIAATAEVEKEMIRTKKEKKVITRLPTIAGGPYGLMDIRPYHSQMIFYDWNYVILQYDVSLHGWAVNIKTEGSSSNQFADYVVNKLKKTKWNPALDQKGQAVLHRLYKQVVIVKEKLYEEDFTKDY